MSARSRKLLNLAFVSFDSYRWEPSAKSAEASKYSWNRRMIVLRLDATTSQPWWFKLKNVAGSQHLSNNQDMQLSRVKLQVHANSIAQLCGFTKEQVAVITEGSTASPELISLQVALEEKLRGQILVVNVPPPLRDQYKQLVLRETNTEKQVRDTAATEVYAFWTCTPSRILPRNVLGAIRPEKLPPQSLGSSGTLETTSPGIVAERGRQENPSNPQKRERNGSRSSSSRSRTPPPPSKKTRPGKSSKGQIPTRPVASDFWPLWGDGGSKSVSQG